MLAVTSAFDVLGALGYCARIESTSLDGQSGSSPGEVVAVGGKVGLGVAEGVGLGETVGANVAVGVAAGVGVEVAEGVFGAAELASRRESQSTR